MQAFVQPANLVSFETWMAAMTASACIGFTSLVPWLFNLTFFERRNKKLGKFHCIQRYVVVVVMLLPGNGAR